MKLILKMEDKSPIIFFIPSNYKGGMIECLSLKDGINTADRGYMRRLKNPESSEDMERCFKLLKNL